MSNAAERRWKTLQRRPSNNTLTGEDFERQLPFFADCPSLLDEQLARILLRFAAAGSA